MRSTAPLSVLTLLLTSGLTAGLVAACSSDDSKPSNPSDAGVDAASFTANAAFSGPADSHCGTRSQAVSAASCHPDAAAKGADDVPADSGAGEAAADDASAGGDSSTSDASASDDASADDAGDDSGGSDYGKTLNNAEGDDDDCKYHIKWLSSPVAQNTDVTFQVTLTKKSDGSAVAGGSVFPEVFLNDTHIAPDTKPTSKDLGNGVYQVSPVRFDQAGKWTVRFHIDEECEDTLEDSPHGHGAFYVVVP